MILKSQWSRGEGDNRALTEWGFAHVTTKTWAYLGVFGFFRKMFVKKKWPPPPWPNHIFKYKGKSIFWLFLNTDQNAPKHI